MQKFYDYEEGDLTDNFQAVLSIVNESLTDIEKARLVQALTPRPEIGAVSPYSWMMDAIQQLTRQHDTAANQLVLAAPLLEAQRLENLDRLYATSVIGELIQSEEIQNNYDNRTQKRGLGIGTV